MNKKNKSTNQFYSFDSIFSSHKNIPSAMTLKPREKKESLFQNSQFSWGMVLTAPLIYSLIIPALIMDLFVSVYQAFCFPVYKLEKVNRRDYIVIDRYKLSYIDSLEKLNCAYCGYFNGLIAYVCEVSARTEAYWCPIKHETSPRGRHEHYEKFADFGDEAGYIEKTECCEFKVV